VLSKPEEFKRFGCTWGKESFLSVAHPQTRYPVRDGNGGKHRVGQMGDSSSCVGLQTGRNSGGRLVASDRHRRVRLWVCTYGRLEIPANAGWKFLLQSRLEAAVSHDGQTDSPDLTEKVIEFYRVGCFCFFFFVVS